MNEQGEVLTKNIDVLQRKLVGLKSAIYHKTTSKGQAKFIQVYIEVISEYIEKSLDALDVDKYKEALIELED